VGDDFTDCVYSNSKQCFNVAFGKHTKKICQVLFQCWLGRHRFCTKKNSNSNFCYEQNLSFSRNWNFCILCLEFKSTNIANLVWTFTLSPNEIPSKNASVTLKCSIMTRRIMLHSESIDKEKVLLAFDLCWTLHRLPMKKSVTSGVRRNFRRGASFVTIVRQHKSTLGEVPKVRPF